MAAASYAKLKISDRVVISAPANSAGARHNGKIGRVVGFVRSWFVLVHINGEGYRFYPTDLRVCSGTSVELAF